MHMENHVTIYELFEGQKIDNPNAYWKDRVVTDLWKYFRLECCSPGTSDALEEYNFITYTEMYYYWRSSVQCDKWDAIADGDRDRDPYNYLMYYVVEKPEKDHLGRDVVYEYTYPVKVYKRNNKIFCKYI